jgi:Ca2+-binding RTX toxin-like protein
MARNRVFNDLFADHDDFIFTGNGDDTVLSTNGSDVIYTFGGDDTIVVTARDDGIFVFGGRGDDTLIILGDNISKERDGNSLIFTDGEGFFLMVEGINNVEVHDL